MTGHSRSADGGTLRVTIELATGGTDTCLGPLPDTTCPRTANDGTPCAGAVLHTAVGEDTWVFTTPHHLRGCPLAWLVDGADAGSATQRRGAFAGGSRTQPVFRQHPWQARGG